MSTWRVLALLALGGCSNLNFAAAVRWNGFVDTDLAFSQFITGDHTVTFRFMPQYTMVGEAPVLSINGSGTYKVGIGDYRAGRPNLLRFGFTPLYLGFAEVWDAVEHLVQVMRGKEYLQSRFQKQGAVT